MSEAAILEKNLVAIIAEEVKCRPDQVIAAAGLLAEGATVAFIARYRKEVTGGLEDEQLENIAKRRTYFLELCERRTTVLESIAAQGKLTPELEEVIGAAVSKQELEDLYLPYKPKRRTRAAKARERGLEPLADALLRAANGDDDPSQLASAFVDPDRDVADSAAALAGARDIIAERLAEDAGNRAGLRRTLRTTAAMSVMVMPGMEAEGIQYRDYFAHSEAAAALPSHRLLAILRGEREGILLSSLEIDDDAETARLAESVEVALTTPCGQQLANAASDAYKRLLRPSIGNEIRAELREKAEAEAIRVFRANLAELLMQPPLGQAPVMGLDPGLRTGCKLAAVDGTGKVVATAVIYPVPPRAKPEAAAAVIVELIKTHGIRAVAVGNGTASRETEAFAREAVRAAACEGVVVAIVPETGASVYSASQVARDELPDLDVTLRGAVSIARRLQDPLAELVKIEPRSMGVGQYQHDVDQRALASELDLAVEGVVNRVGIEVNTASPSLLRRVSGLSERIARAIVSQRDGKGPFPSRKDLLKVPGLGAKTFLQAAGFLRVGGGANPLDATAVHPERYPVVEKMARHLGVKLGDLLGRPEVVSQVDFASFADQESGLGSFTLADIRSELERPGRDPRPTFEVPEWRQDVLTPEDLEPDMILEGRVSNVANFGAFVDIGVKRDGLVHLSELSQRWVDDPRSVVHVGQIVKVKVLEVDHDRGRISLSIKALEPPPADPGRNRQAKGKGKGQSKGKGQRSAPSQPQSGRPASMADLANKFAGRRGRSAR